MIDVCRRAGGRPECGYPHAPFATLSPQPYVAKPGINACGSIRVCESGSAGIPGSDWGTDMKTASISRRSHLLVAVLAIGCTDVTVENYFFELDGGEEGQGGGAQVPVNPGGPQPGNNGAGGGQSGYGGGAAGGGAVNNPPVGGGQAGVPDAATGGGAVVPDAGDPGGTGGGDSPPAPGADPTFCQERCNDMSQCLPGWSCENGLCAQGPGCTLDDECLPRMSGWQTECLDDTGCNQQVCVTVGETGYCAMAPSEFVTCEQMTLAEMELPHHGTAEMVIVCAQTRAVCWDGVCNQQCASDEHCFGEEYPHCNVATGRCECNEGTCVTNGTLCEEGRCRCVSDEECTTQNFDVCYDGTCGCSSVEACVTPLTHPGATWVCETWPLAEGDE